MAKTNDAIAAYVESRRTYLKEQDNFIDRIYELRNNNLDLKLTLTVSVQDKLKEIYESSNPTDIELSKYIKTLEDVHLNFFCPNCSSPTFCAIDDELTYTGREKLLNIIDDVMNSKVNATTNDDSAIDDMKADIFASGFEDMMNLPTSSRPETNEAAARTKDAKGDVFPQTDSPGVLPGTVPTSRPIQATSVPSMPEYRAGYTANKAKNYTNSVDALSDMFGYGSAEATPPFMTSPPAAMKNSTVAESTRVVSPSAHFPEESVCLQESALQTKANEQYMTKNNNSFEKKMLVRTLNEIRTRLEELEQRLFDL